MVIRLVAGRHTNQADDTPGDTACPVTRLLRSCVRHSHTVDAGWEVGRVIADFGLDSRVRLHEARRRLLPRELLDQPLHRRRQPDVRHGAGGMPA